MTQRELEQKRVELWRLRPDLAPNDEKEIREFIKEAGFCYTYHIPKDTIPSLIQTITGSVNSEKQFRFSPSDPFYEMLNETFRSYSNHKLFVEISAFGKHPVIVYRDVFARLYRILGTEVRGGYLARRKRNTKLENEIVTYLNEKGATSRRELRMTLLNKQKNNTIELSKALDALGRQLKIVRIRASNNGLMWITPEKWNPRLCRDAADIDREEAIEYLIIRCIRIAVALSRKGLKRFFKNIIPTDVIDLHLNSLIQRKLIVTDPDLIIDGKRALKIR